MNSPTNAAFDTSVARNGTRSLRLNPSAAVGRIFTKSFSAGSVMVWRFYLRFAALPTSDTAISSFQAGAGSGVGFKSADSSLYAFATDSAPSFGASGIPVTTGIWYRIDVKTITSANPWLIDVQVDGVSCAQLSFSTGAVSGSSIQIGSGGTSETFDFYVDDLLVSQTSDDYPIGPGYVNHFVPTADGTHNVAGTNDFERTLTGTDIDNTTTDSYLLVDDIPLESSLNDWINLTAPLNATDYVENVFGPAPGINTPTTAPRSVEFLAAYHAAAVQTNNLRVAYRDSNGGTQDDVLNATVGSETILYIRKQYTTIPGGGAWTVTAFNNSRAQCYSSDANPDPRLDGYMIEAEWAEVAVAGIPSLVTAPYIPA